jgi:hypothetical protein
MSKYNLGQNERAKCALTIAELCVEIADENKDLISNSPDTLRDKFKNHDNSGIIDKLGNKLNFRIEEFDDKYDQLKLLKYLYYLEKYGLSKNKSTRNNDKTKFRIIDVLNKPRLDNINSHISVNNAYGNILSKMKSDIEKEIRKEAIFSKQEKFNYIKTYWEEITHKTFDYVMSEMALNKKDSAYEELERIERYLKHKILERLPDVSELKLPYKESLFDTFYNIVMSHEVLCYDADRLRINYQIVLEEPPVDEYIEAFIKYEDKWLVKEERLAGILNKLCNLNDEYDVETEIISMLIFKKFKLSNDDIGDAKFAFKYVKTLLSWLAEFKNLDFTEGYPLSILASAIQEIVYVNKNKELLINDFYGNKYYRKSMISSLKDAEAVSAVVKTAWIYKIENRYSVNLGAYELVKKKRDVENTIYAIKRKLFEYQNISDLEIANSLALHFAARSLTSRKVAMAVGAEFANMVVDICGPYQFLMFDEGINVLNMFREFLLSRKTMERVAKEIGEMIREFENEKPHNYYTKTIAKGMQYSFRLSLNEKYDKKFLFLFFVDRERRVLEYKDFMEIVDDEYAQEQIRIGLGEFIFN